LKSQDRQWQLCLKIMERDMRREWNNPERVRASGKPLIASMSSIEDIRAAAAVAKGRKVASHVVAFVVPGSGLVKAQAEAEGLDKVGGVDDRNCHAVRTPRTNGGGTLKTDAENIGAKVENSL
jgi:hypothetical protein